MTKVHGLETLFHGTAVESTPTNGEGSFFVQSSIRIQGIYFIDNMIFMLVILFHNKRLHRHPGMI